MNFETMHDADLFLQGTNQPDKTALNYDTEYATSVNKENIDRHNLSSMDVKKWENVLKNESFEIIQSGYFGGFDFWVDYEKRGIIKKIITKTLTHIPALRFLPNNRVYSPEIILVAKKIK